MRLSSLQKGLLTECFDTIQVYKNHQWPNGLLIIKQIFNKYQNRSNKFEASVSRSIRNLADKNLIVLLTPRVLISNHPYKIDYAQATAIQFQKAGKSQEEWKVYIEDLKKRNGKNSKFLDLALPADTVKAFTLTDLGVNTVLMLSNLNLPKLNNKQNEVI